MADLESRLQSRSSDSPCLDSGDPRMEHLSELSADAVLLSLNATAEPFFVGASSGCLLSKVVQSLLAPTTYHSPDVELARRPLNNHSNNSSTTDLSSELPADVEDSFVSVYFSKVHPRYPFMDKVSFYEVYNQRRLSSPDKQPDKTYLFIIYMIQAIGARISQLHQNLPSGASPEVFEN